MERWGTRGICDRLLIDGAMGQGWYLRSFIDRWNDEARAVPVTNMIEVI